jgi:outer membrane receptor for ferrienterochelin and colicins
MLRSNSVAVPLALSLIICVGKSSLANADTPDAGDASSADATAGNLQEVTVTAQRLNEARSQIETQTGASTYTIDSAAIAATPGGDNTLLNQLILQAPEVAQDSFGQFHARGEHNGAQYRLNGIILPEGLSVFGQTLDPRLISSMKLIEGSLPAEYGLRTGIIIDLTTKSGAIDPGGSVSVYGGSHGSFEPSIAYGGSSGSIDYFVAGGFLRNDLGIESPDGSINPIHDHTSQYHGFGYVEDILGDNDRVGLMFGTSSGKFQIPNQPNLPLAPLAGITGLGPNEVLQVNGQSAFPSADLNENQRELTHFGFVSWQHSADALNYQTAFIARYSSLNFTPDPIGDLLYTGIAQNAFKSNTAYAWQTDGSYQLADTHTVRAGFYVQRDESTSDTTSQVLPLDPTGLQTSDVPQTVIDTVGKTEWIYSVYLQDEWQILQPLTLNYGARFDRFTAFTSASQLSPRVNLVWQALPDTTVHVGYSRYLSPPPFELVGGKSVAKFQGTTAYPAVTLDIPPEAERANNYDAGVQQTIFQGFVVGLDAYYKQSVNLIDEGQFGAPIILTPFNYRFGQQYGIELTSNYTAGAFSAYANFSTQSDLGKDFNSAQFNFSPGDLAYVTNHYIDLDHEQKFTGSGGVSYLWRDTRFSTDFLFGSGLRAALLLPNGSDIPNGEHLPYYWQFNLGTNHVFHLPGAGTLTARFDVINVFDRIYQIRNGTGVGVGAPQYGPRRGVFFGLAKSLGEASR